MPNNVATPLILPYRGIVPKIHPTAFIAPGAVIIGDVEIGPDTSIWFGCVVRGDVNAIRIGARTNIQDGTVIHVASGLQPARMAPGNKVPASGYPTLIGDDVTVGHMTLLHACTLESGAFVGMKSAVMDGARIESQGMLAAGALLTAGKTIGRGQLWAGTPAKFWRDLTSEDMAQFDLRANQYVELGREYREKTVYGSAPAQSKQTSSPKSEKPDDDHTAYIDKLAERPLTTQFNVSMKHIDKDLAVHWPVIHDPHMEAAAQRFFLGPAKNVIQKFAEQNNFHDVLVTLIITKDAKPPAVLGPAEGTARFETGNGSRIILVCQESPYHAHLAMDERGYVMHLDKEEAVYTVTEQFLEVFFGQAFNLFTDSKNALRRTLMGLHQHNEANPHMTQIIYNLLLGLGLLKGGENIARDNIHPSLLAVEGADFFLLPPVATAIEAYALNQALNQNLEVTERLFFRSFSQELHAVYHPAIKEAALIAAADLDHHHTPHPNAQTAHQDLTLRRQAVHHHQTLEPGGGGGEG